MRRVSWGAIFVGTVIAMALMVFFTTLGLAIGAAAVDPAQEADPFSGLGVGSGIYLVITQLIALAVGGFAAARLAGVPRSVGSLLHGASVWALATLFMAWAAIAGGSAVFGVTSSVLGSTARGATDAIQAVVPDDLSFPDFAEIASRVSVEDLPPELQQTLEENDITVDDLRQETQTAFRNVVSQQEQERALSILRGAIADAVRSPGDIASDVNAAIDSLVAGEDAVFSQEDREEVLTVLEQRLGLTGQEVEQIVQAVETRVETTISELRQTVEQAQQRAVEAAQTASSVLATTATWLTIASLLGLAAALGGAFAGKPEGVLGSRLDTRY
jgi:uncharacterized tellurite resistance protein B-like protein